VKKLSIVILFLFLVSYSALEAQTIFDSVTVVTDESAPSVNLISNDSQSLDDVHCHAIKISNESSHDVIINGATFSCSSQYAESRLDMYGVYVTIGTIPIGEIYSWSINNIDGYRDLDFSFYNPTTIPRHSSIIIDLRSNLYGWGQFVFSLREVIFTDAETFETEAVKYWGNSVIGKDITLANTDHLTLKSWIYPRSWNQEYADTLYVLPGEYFYSSGSCETNRSNYVPKAITAFKSNANISIGSQTDLHFGQIWIDNLQQIGHVDTVTTNFDQSVVWTANSLDNGIDIFNLSWVFGYNTMPIGGISYINFYTEAVFLSSNHPVPTSDYIGHNRVIKSIDGILGDFTGDGEVLANDVDEMQSLYATYGGFMDFYTYTNEGYNIGRTSILFDSATLLDILLLRIWINNPMDPSVKDLGIGQLMSTRSKPAPATYSKVMSGNTITINTRAFAVRISAMLPSGKLWSNSTQVSGNQAVFTVPDQSLKYKIEAVSLPNSTTGVENNLSTPIEFNLSQNYPNPFNPSTTISYSLPTSSFVNLKIYDILGKEVATLVNEEKIEGNYSINFDGSKLASGTYLCRLVSGAFSQTQKMILMK
jgi:hypothetical protein